MKETEKLIQLITRFGPSKLPLLNQATPKTRNLEQQLYENIKTGKYKNEEEALLDLYGSEDDYHKYRMLKSRVKQKLYNHILFVEYDGVIAKKEEKRCIDLVHKGKSLLLLTEYDLAKKQFDKAIKVAISYEFNEIVIDCLEKIVFMSTQIPNPNLYSKSTERLDYFRRVKLIEDKASKVYHEARLTLLGKTAVKKSYLNGIPKKTDILKRLWKKTGSFNIFRKYYALNIWFYELTGDFVGEIRALKRYERSLSDGNINLFRFDSRIIKYSMAYALLRTRKYEEGLTHVNNCISLFPVYSRNWFAFKEYHFLLALHSGQLKLAEKVIQEVEAQKSKLLLRKTSLEKWTLYKAFLYFVSPGYNYFDFSFSQFLDTVPTHTRDKLGHNISILILHFLYLLKKKDYEQLSCREETFRKYTDTYLKNPYSKRSFFLFKLMLLIIRVDFCPEKSAVKGQPIFKKMKDTPEPGDAYSSIEIVPYENLWEVMLQYLKSNKSIAVCS